MVRFQQDELAQLRDLQEESLVDDADRKKQVAGLQAALRISKVFTEIASLLLKQVFRGGMVDLTVPHNAR